MRDSLTNVAIESWKSSLVCGNMHFTVEYTYWNGYRVQVILCIQNSCFFCALGY